jgi:hypothetical protein
MIILWAALAVALGLVGGMLLVKWWFDSSRFAARQIDEQEAERNTRPRGSVNVIRKP